MMRVILASFVLASFLMEELWREPLLRLIPHEQPWNALIYYREFLLGLTLAVLFVRLFIGSHRKSRSVLDAEKRKLLSEIFIMPDSFSQLRTRIQMRSMMEKALDKKLKESEKRTDEKKIQYAGRK